MDLFFDAHRFSYEMHEVILKPGSTASLANAMNGGKAQLYFFSPSSFAIYSESFIYRATVEHPHSEAQSARVEKDG